VRIHHIALRTRDLARLRSFYVGVLGLQIAKEDAQSIWLRVGDALVMLEPASPSEPEVPSGSMEMVAFAITPEQRTSFVHRLAAAGAAIESETAYTIYVRDPDGRRVGLSHYPN
jgi:catechol 2,3-dioxygenase-like lactoylglutathione lyase family enzyme